MHHFIPRRVNTASPAATVALATIVGSTLLLIGPLHAETLNYVNPHPEIQMYSYPAGSATGAGAVRDRAPTFGSYSGIDEQNQPYFYPGTGLDPSRRGSFIAVADASTDVPMGLEPHRYQIDSLKVTTTMIGSLIYEPLNYVLHYDNTLDDSLALTTEGGDDLGQPMEMYGIGLHEGYAPFSFDPNDSSDEAFHLGDPRWRAYRPDEPGYDPDDPDALGPYKYFALDADGRDAENAVYGGYSATEPDNATEQFTPAPFAIGKLFATPGVEAEPGSLLVGGDQFVFEPDLSDEGIVAYLQESLAAGHLGFSFSSLHQPSGHTSTAPYPDFYLDDLDEGYNPNGAAPTIELQVTILDDALPGDFNADDVVDGRDFLAWQRSMGQPVDPIGSGADGDGDGTIGAGDLAVWESSFGPAAGGVIAVAAIPEPPSLLLAVFAVSGLGMVIRQLENACGHFRAH